MIPPRCLTIKPTVAAAVLLVALEIAQAQGTSSLPTNAAQVLDLTQAGRSQAYQMRSRLRETLETLHQPAGRPRQAQPDSDRRVAVARSVLDFVMRHPGAVVIRAEHRSYNDSFRRFVVGLFHPQGLAAGLTIPHAAEAIGMPVGTLKDWLSTASVGSPSIEPSADDPSHDIDPIVQCAQPEMATLLSEYEAWEGDLSAFCEHARTQLHLPFGRTFITHVLTAAGLYHPKPRRAPHQAPWSRGSLVTMFPGMQWFGDGKQMRIIYQGQRLLFNIEAMVDGASNAVVGARVTDTEDAKAVIEAFDEGLETTGGQPPMATTLDNRPSNFSPQIDDALSCTQLLRATPGRGQAKAPVEGSFGLFAQCLPEVIVVEGNTDRDIARSILQHVVHAFYLGRNGKSRSKLGGQTPSEAYDHCPPTQEQIQAAKRWILEQRRRESTLRQSRERRADPVRRKLLQEQLARLGIDDPQGQASLSLASYSMDAIVRGIAIFRAKQQMDTLPSDCDPYRYLGGIIRNVESRDFFERMAENLLALRMRAGDLHLTPLRQTANAILKSAPSDAAAKLVNAALDASSLLAFRFWTSQARQVFSTMPSSSAMPLVRHMARIIAACSRVQRAWREQLIAALAEAVAPVAA